MKKNNIYVLLVIACVSFLALGGIFVKLSNLGPINTGLYRIIISIPILLPFVYNKYHYNKKDIMIMIVAGGFLAIILILTQPVIAALYSFFIFHERLTIVESVGIFIVLTGIFFSKKTS